MANMNRKPIFDRMTALVAGPFLLGWRALDLAWVNAPGSPPEPSSEASTRLTVTPPVHAIKRRG